MLEYIDAENYTTVSWKFSTLNEIAKQEYAENYCFSLANKLAAKLGGKVYHLTDYKEKEPYYAFVEYQGLFIDINGSWTKDNLLLFWDHYQTEMSFHNKGLIYYLQPAVEFIEDDFEPGMDTLVDEIITQINN